MSAKMILAALLILITACASFSKQADTNLYQKLGGTEGIDKLVYATLINFAQDERIATRFRDVNIARFKTGFVNYVCSLSGGPCEYSGDSMAIVHAGHNYTNTEFNAVVENLIKAMEEQGLSVTTQNQLLALLAPSYKDVVYH